MAVLLFGAIRGWRNGLVKEVISFVGLFLGFYIAYQMYQRADVGVVGFLLIWVGVPLALGAVAWMITKLLDHIIIVGTANRLLGAAAGFLKFAFLLGCLLTAYDYVCKVKTEAEKNEWVKVLELAPDYLFPEINKEVENGEE